MNKNILFAIRRERQWKLRFGELAYIIQACYYKGKELGYEDYHIFIEWPLNYMFSDIRGNRIDIEFPESDSILPIIFINRKNSYDEYDQILYLDDYGTFYEDSPPLYEEKEGRKVHSHMSFLNYLNKYRMENNKSPHIELKMTNIDKPYILFHIRYTPFHNTQRNSDFFRYKELVKIVKEHYGDKYEYWQTGEHYKPLNKYFDKLIPYYNNDINKFISIVNNSSFCITPPSGPDCWMEMLNKPMILMDIPLVEKNGKPPARGKEWWKQAKGVYGDSMHFWRDKSKYMMIQKNEDLNKNNIIQFMDKWLK